MGKIGAKQVVKIADLKPYERNARTHSEEQVGQIARSIEEFGFLNPVLIDEEKNVIAGHGRIMAAQKLGMTEVPCLYVEGLTEDQRRAYILADNRLTELGGWDMETVYKEVDNLINAGFDVNLTGFDFDINIDTKGDWFDVRERFDTDRQEENDEYNSFLDKFEIKKTTDDCYTPDGVYEALAEWVANEYGIDRNKFFRPFYPNGDYKRENYAGKVVVDNPPFSILSEILNYYAEQGVQFFLFAPTLTLFSSAAATAVTCLPIGAAVLYENGAGVNTSFITNLEPEEIRVKTAPSLYKVIDEAVDKYRKEIHKELPKYSYPDEIITAPMVARWCKYGLDYTLTKKESEPISALDAQREEGKTIYGKGFILSKRAAAERAAAERATAERAAAERAAAERAAAERAAAQRWSLSDREKAIVERLGA